MRATPGKGWPPALGTIHSAAHQTPPNVAARGAGPLCFRRHELRRTTPCLTVAWNVLAVTGSITIVASMPSRARHWRKGSTFLSEDFSQGKQPPLQPSRR